MKRRLCFIGLVTCLGWVPVWGGILAQFHTPAGDLDVELLEQDKPITVQNFLRYVQSGAYANMFMHRCASNFVIQGGGFAVLDPADTGLFARYAFVTNYGNLTNEFSVGRTLKNVYSTLAMAKVAGDPNSASSQWFFNLSDNSENLDNQNGGFTVFGRVIGDTNTLTKFKQLEPLGGGIVDLREWYGDSARTFAELPVSYQGNTPPYYRDLMYVDITLLNVQVKLQVEGSREISWNSVSNRQNRVEFSPQWPPAWQTLTSVKGTGQPMNAVDGSRSDPRRFYRVRVDY